MFSSFTHKVRTRFSKAAAADESGFALAEVVIAVPIAFVLGMFLATGAQNALTVGEAEQQRSEARSSADLLRPLVTDAVRSSVGVARVDEAGTSVFLREADGSCTQLSLVGSEVRERSFTFFGASEKTVSERVLISNAAQRDGTPAFTKLDLGVQVALTVGGEQTVSSDIAALPDTVAATPDSQCTYLPFG